MISNYKKLTALKNLERPRLVSWSIVEASIVVEECDIDDFVFEEDIRYLEKQLNINNVR